MKSLQALLITFIILSTLPTFGQSKQNEKAVNRVDSLFNYLYQKNKTGAAFAILKNGKTIYKNTKGLANVEYQISITDSTVFNIASISKQFTTYVALILEEEGKLSFKDDIRKHLPELAHLPHKITIKQLTNHTHGLPNVDDLARLKNVQRMAHWQVVQMALNIQQTNFIPGEKYQYGNTAYVLLTEIIKRVGKKSFEAQLKEKIFTPLRMKSSQANGYASGVIANKAVSYNVFNNHYIYNPIELETMGSSGVYTNINDMILWAKHYYNTIVGNQSFYSKMKAATKLNSGKKIKYGMGLQFDNYKGIDVVFHGGGTASYRSYILHVPAYNLSFVFLANSGGFSGLDMIYKSLDFVLEKFIQNDQPKKITYTDKELQKFTGIYEQSPGNYYTIFTEKNNLFFKTYGSNEKVLLPVLEKSIFKFALPYSKFVFSKDKLNFIIGDFNYECKKISINPPKIEAVKLSDFIGIYRNKAHQITLELILDNNNLKVKQVFNDSFTLNPLTKTSFYAQGFGKLDFTIDSNKDIHGFKISGANFRNIEFKKK